MRVLFLAGYENASYQRKVELLADAPDVELLQVNSSQRISAGRKRSANGQRTYTVAHVRPLDRGHPLDPHRRLYWPPGFGMAAFRPDVIHCEFEQESLGAAQVVLARRALRPSAKLILYSYQNLLRPRRRAVRWLSRLTQRAAQAVVCASTEATWVLRQQGYQGLTPVLPSVGMDLNVFKPERAVATGAPLVIGYAGRLAPEKCVSAVVRAVARLPSPARLIIVGEGQELASLRALALGLGLAGRCEFRPPIDHTSMPALLNELDVLVLPSRTTPHWKEQFGRILIEAMACGTVVVGSDSGSIPEVIGDAGRIFPESDEEALVRTLDDLARHPAQRLALAQRGVERVRDHYTVEHVAGELLKLWRLLTG